MAKRELSTTLKNLKFMQRGAQKVEKPKKDVEETKPDGEFGSPSNVNRKCVVILEGDPHPGTVRGRMSFQNFNPSIDKLNDEAANHEAEASTSSSFQTGRDIGRENGASEHTEMNMDQNNADGEQLKRKQSEGSSQKNHRKKLQKDAQGNKQASPNENSSRNQPKPKRDKLDYNVLVPPKSQSKRKGG